MTAPERPPLPSELLERDLEALEQTVSEALSGVPTAVRVRIEPALKALLRFAETATLAIAAHEGMFQGRERENARAARYAAAYDAANWPCREECAEYQRDGTCVHIRAEVDAALDGPF